MAITINNYKICAFNYKYNIQYHIWITIQACRLINWEVLTIWITIMIRIITIAYFPLILQACTEQNQERVKAWRLTLETSPCLTCSGPWDCTLHLSHTLLFFSGKHTNQTQWMKWENTLAGAHAHTLTTTHAASCKQKNMAGTFQAAVYSLRGRLQMTRRKRIRRLHLFPLFWWLRTL